MNGAVCAYVVFVLRHKRVTCEERCARSNRGAFAEVCCPSGVCRGSCTFPILPRIAGGETCGDVGLYHCMLGWFVLCSMLNLCALIALLRTRAARYGWQSANFWISLTAILGPWVFSRVDGVSAPIVVMGLVLASTRRSGFRPTLRSDMDQGLAGRCGSHFGGVEQSVGPNYRRWRRRICSHCPWRRGGWWNSQPAWIHPGPKGTGECSSEHHSLRPVCGRQFSTLERIFTQTLPSLRWKSKDPR